MNLARAGIRVQILSPKPAAHKPGQGGQTDAGRIHTEEMAPGYSGGHA
jgi:hypothetical protein